MQLSPYSEWGEHEGEASMCVCVEGHSASPTISRGKLQNIAKPALFKHKTSTSKLHNSAVIPASAGVCSRAHTHSAPSAFSTANKMATRFLS